MKVRRHIVKAVRACDDDWYEDETPYLYAGTSYELGDESPRFRSVSREAHRAMNAKPAAAIGFHRPAKD